MANLGEATEIANSGEGQLQIGATPDIWVALTDLQINVMRPEDRAPTTDLGTLFTYGKGDHSMSFTLIATTPELKTLVDYNILGANGGINNDGGTLAWKVQVTNLAGGTATFTCTGNLRGCSVRMNGVEGKWAIDCDIRITTDTVAVTVA